MTKTQIKALNLAEAKVAEAMGIIEDLKGELEEKFDEMSEKSQEGEKGEALQEEINTLDEIYSNLETEQGSIAGLITLD